MATRVNMGVSLARIVRISRPRFWAYEAGTFAIGCMLALRPLEYPLHHVTPILLAFLFYFLFPANLLIYGVNDIFDYETDRLNPKKVEYEALVTPNEHRPLTQWIAITTFPFLLLLFYESQPTIISFAFFLIFAVFYSAWPLRAKVRPGFDSLFSAGHYVATGVFGYYLAGGAALDWQIVAAAMCWSIAMHAYSAVPDIEFDGESGVDTIATFLGREKTLWLCLLLYITATLAAFEHLGAIAIVLGVIYAAIVIASIYAKSADDLFRLYTYFPLLNLASGFAIFLTLAIFQRYALF
ncbi:MAG: prenyltransferase [Hyphomicrobiales bacterium]|nr:prenyltransferase [Hyphomicrobiales bacterium]